MLNEHVVDTYEEWLQQSPQEFIEKNDMEGVLYLTDLIDHYALGPVVVYNGEPVPISSHKANRLDEIRDHFAGEDVIFFMLLKTEPYIDPNTMDEAHSWIVRFSIAPKK